MSVFEIWDILIPVADNDGNDFDIVFHTIWDQKVRDICGGLTIYKPVKGQWLNTTGKLFLEEMIPVRILASQDAINRIVDMTLVYYNQESILAYKISDEVILRSRGEGS